MLMFQNKSSTPSLKTCIRPWLQRIINISSVCARIPFNTVNKGKVAYDVKNG